MEIKMARTSNKKSKGIWRILCWLGIHDWAIEEERGFMSYRECRQCGCDQHYFLNKWKE